MISLKNKVADFFSMILVAGIIAGTSLGCSPERPLDGSASQSYDTVPLIDRNVFFGDPEIAGVQLSPDGAITTFRKPLDGVMNIWIKESESDFDSARPLTADTLRPVRTYFWSHDSNYIFYIQDKGGDENFHIYRVDVNEEPNPDTKVPQSVNLTPIEGVRAQLYSLPRAYPDRMIIGINDRDPAVHDVYYLDIESGEKTLLVENTEGMAGWLTDRDGNVRAGLRQTEDGGTEMLMIREDGFEQVYSSGPEETFSPARYHEDGTHIYMVSNTGDRDKMEFFLFNPDTGEVEFIESDPEDEVDFGGAIFSDVTNEILATVYVGDKPRVYYHNDEFKAMMDRIREEVQSEDISIMSRTHDEQQWLFYVGSDVDPGSVYFYDLETDELRLLYRTRPDLPSEYLAEMTPVRYTARDGLEIPAYLTIPKGFEAKDLPVIVVPHGGPWARDYWGYSPVVQFLANRGYAVFQINFRGSTGFGKAFLNAGNKEWGTGAMQHDITDGVAYLISEGIADPERVAIYGGSYGGFATLAGLAFTPDLYAAGISMVGPSNIITLLNSIPPYWGPIRKIFHTRVGNPDDPNDYAMLVEQSPLFSAEEIKAPLMVVQGANDPRVPQAESDQIVVAMRDLGREVVYLVAEDEGHGFAGLENRIAFFFAMESFFAEHLGGRYQEDLENDYMTRLEDMTVDVNTVEVPESSPELDMASSAALPSFDASELDGYQAEYSVEMLIQGNLIELDLVRTATLVASDDETYLALRDQMTSQMGNVTDEMRVNPTTYAPISRTYDQGGMANIAIVYAPDTITGKLQFGMQEQDIHLELDAPVFSDGHQIDFFVSHMVANDINAAYLRYFDLTTQEIRIVKAVSSPEEPHVRVTFEALDQKRSDRTYTVDGDGTILVIEDVLPPAAGGGRITMTKK